VKIKRAGIAVAVALVAAGTVTYGVSQQNEGSFSGAKRELGVDAEPADSVEAVCFDFRMLVEDMYYSSDPAGRRWMRPVDELGVRAAMLDSNDGADLMAGIARLSVGIEEQDLYIAGDGLDAVSATCDREGA